MNKLNRSQVRAINNSRLTFLYLQEKERERIIQDFNPAKVALQGSRDTAIGKMQYKEANGGTALSSFISSSSLRSGKVIPVVLDNWSDARPT